MNRNKKKVSTPSEDSNNVQNKNQMNGIAKSELDSDITKDEETMDCASLPQSYHNEWKKLFLRSDYLKNLKKLSIQGSLRSSRFRSVCWKIFMGVLPEDMSCWIEKTRDHRAIYDDLKMQMITNPRRAEPRDLSINNPLSQVTESPWNQFFIDNGLRLTIKQDVIRTHPKIEFFHTDDIRTNMVDILFVYAKMRPTISYRQVVKSSLEENDFPEIDFFNSASIHVLMVEALFVYAKRFPHLAYMQGMHELLAPLIFVLHCDQQAFLHACETDTISQAMSAFMVLQFWLLAQHVIQPTFLHENIELIKEILDPEYLEHDALLTNSMITTPFARPQELIPSNVIVTKLTRIQDYLLKRFDPQLFEHLQKLDIAPQVYGIRWVRLLFGREFPFQDLLILWDAIFADGIGFDLVDYVFVAMLMYLRGSLLCSDYSSCLTPLMKFPPVPDVHYFINKALYLRDPKNQPQVADQFYCKPQSSISSEGGRNGETASLSSRFSKLVRGKRPGSLLISSGLMSKSTSEPMNLITDSALSPVKENLQFTPSRKGSSASLPPPDIGTPLLSGHLHNFSCQSLHRLDMNSGKNDSTNLMSDSSTGSPHSSGKFFIFGARGGRKYLSNSMPTNKVKQVKGTSEQEIIKALNSYSEMESVCRRCAMELDGYIGTLQKHLFKRDMPNGSSNDESFLALAGIKQIRDILKGAVKPSFLNDSPEHIHHSVTLSSDGSSFPSLRRKQHPVSAQSSLSGTPMCDRPLGKFYLATPDVMSYELESPDTDAKSTRSDTSFPNRTKVGSLRISSKSNLPSEVELDEVYNGLNNTKGNNADSRVPINLHFKPPEATPFSTVESIDDVAESTSHPVLVDRNSPSYNLQPRQVKNKEGEMSGVAKRREGSPMDRIADVFRSFGKL